MTRRQRQKLKKNGIIPEHRSLHAEAVREAKKRIYRRPHCPAPHQFEVPGRKVISTALIEL